VRGDVARACNGPSSPVQRAARAASAYAGAQQPGVRVAGCTWCVCAPVEGERGPPHAIRFCDRSAACNSFTTVPVQGLLGSALCAYAPEAQGVVQVFRRRLHGVAAQRRGRTGTRACGAAACGRARWGIQAWRPPRGSATTAPARRPQATAATGAGARPAAAATAAAAAAATAAGRATAAAATTTNRCRSQRCAYGSLRESVPFGAVAVLPFLSRLAGVAAVLASLWGTQCGHGTGAAAGARTRLRWRDAGKWLLWVPALTGPTACCVLCLTGAGAGRAPAEQH